MEGRSGLRSSFWKSFGPGLLWAATAIGVSHLVQSTRAGAVAGFGLAGIVALALVVKYPLFEFGPRYAAATGESLIEGYARVGGWAIRLYFLLTVMTSVIVQSAVVLFTSVLLRSVFSLSWPLPVVAAAVCAGCAALLSIGRFRGLDVTVKVLVVVLAVTTVVAAVVAAPRVDMSATLWLPFEKGRFVVSLAFVLALIGWMPSGIDTAAWSSLWTQAHDRSRGSRTSVADALRDFRVAYVTTGVLAFAFILLGAAVMYDSGESFAAQGTRFSLQLLDLYSATLGEWLRPVVTVAVITTMLSTSVAVIDGFPRAIDRSIRVLQRQDRTRSGYHGVGVGYWIAMTTLAVATVVIVATFLGSMTSLIDFATIVSFLTAPLLGFLNLRVMCGEHVPIEHRPGRGLRGLAVVGLILLGVTAVVYVISGLA